MKDVMNALKAEILRREHDLKKLRDAYELLADDYAPTVPIDGPSMAGCLIVGTRPEVPYVDTHPDFPPPTQHVIVVDPRQATLPGVPPPTEPATKPFAHEPGWREVTDEVSALAEQQAKAPRAPRAPKANASSEPNALRDTILRQVAAAGPGGIKAVDLRAANDLSKSVFRSVTHALVSTGQIRASGKNNGTKYAIADNAEAAE